MPQAPLPVTGKAYQNVDPISLVDFSEDIIDAYVDESGTTVKRPGLESFVSVDGTSGTGVQGLWWWPSQNFMLAARDRRLYKIIKDGTVTELTGATLTNSTTRVVFSDNGSNAVITNGGTMISTDGATSSYITDVDAPDDATHSVFLDQYILANDAGTQFAVFSEVGDYTDWNALNTIAFEGASDKVNGVFVSGRELLLTGNQSMEFYYNDGVTPWVRIQGAFINHGVSAPYTMKFVKELNTWIFLDHQRRLVVIEGRVPKSVSTPFDKTIQDLDVIDDARGDILRTDGRTFYILTFPTEDKTFVYDFKLDSWSRWGEWDTSTGTYKRWLGNITEFAEDWGFHLVGSKADGNIYKSSSSAFDDDGAIIRPSRTTGFIDHGTFNKKTTNRLVIKVKRGVGIASAPNTEPILLMRYRNEGQTWSNYTEIKMGRSGDKDFVARLHNLGIYTSRQWEFTMADPTSFRLVGAIEDFMVHAF